MEYKQPVKVERLATPTIKITIGGKVFTVTEEQAKELLYKLRTLLPTTTTTYPWQIPYAPCPETTPIPDKPYVRTIPSDKVHIWVGDHSFTHSKQLDNALVQPAQTTSKPKPPNKAYLVQYPPSTVGQGVTPSWGWGITPSSHQDPSQNP